MYGVTDARRPEKCDASVFSALEWRGRTRTSNRKQREDTALDPFRISIPIWRSGSEGRTGLKSADLIYPPAPPAYPLYDRSTVHDERGWQINNVHDPAIIREGEWYYVFSTDRKAGADEEHPVKAGLQVRRSRDLIHWEWMGYALTDVPEEAKRWTRAEILWAPDVAKFGDAHYLYYVASRFGTDHSFIGMATGSSILGPWSDRGEVLKTGCVYREGARGYLGAEGG